MVIIRETGITSTARSTQASNIEQERQEQEREKVLREEAAKARQRGEMLGRLREQKRSSEEILAKNTRKEGRQWNIYSRRKRAAEELINYLEGGGSLESRQGRWLAYKSSRWQDPSITDQELSKRFEVAEARRTGDKAAERRAQQNLTEYRGSIHAEVKPRMIGGSKVTTREERLAREKEESLKNNPTIQRMNRQAAMRQNAIESPVMDVRTNAEVARAAASGLPSGRAIEGIRQSLTGEDKGFTPVKKEIDPTGQSLPTATTIRSIEDEAKVRNTYMDVINYNVAVREFQKEKSKKNKAEQARRLQERRKNLINRLESSEFAKKTNEGVEYTGFNLPEIEIKSVYNEEPQYILKTTKSTETIKREPVKVDYAKIFESSIEKGIKKLPEKAQPTARAIKAADEEIIEMGAGIGRGYKKIGGMIGESVQDQYTTIKEYGLKSETGRVIREERGRQRLERSKSDSDIISAGVVTATLPLAAVSGTAGAVVGFAGRGVSAGIAGYKATESGVAFSKGETEKGARSAAQAIVFGSIAGIKGGGKVTEKELTVNVGGKPFKIIQEVPQEEFLSVKQSYLQGSVTRGQETFTTQKGTAIIKGETGTTLGSFKTGIAEKNVGDMLLRTGRTEVITAKPSINRLKFYERYTPERINKPYELEFTEITAQESRIGGIATEGETSTALKPLVRQAEPIKYRLRTEGEAQALTKRFIENPAEFEGVKFGKPSRIGDTQVSEVTLKNYARGEGERITETAGTQRGRSTSQIFTEEEYLTVGEAQLGDIKLELGKVRAQTQTGSRLEPVKPLQLEELPKPRTPKARKPFRTESASTKKTGTSERVQQEYAQKVEAETKGVRTTSGNFAESLLTKRYKTVTVEPQTPVRPMPKPPALTGRVGTMGLTGAGIIAGAGVMPLTKADFTAGLDFRQPTIIGLREGTREVIRPKDDTGLEEIQKPREEQTPRKRTTIREITTPKEITETPERVVPRPTGTPINITPPPILRTPPRTFVLPLPEFKKKKKKKGAKSLYGLDVSRRKNIIANLARLPRLKKMRL